MIAPMVTQNHGGVAAPVTMPPDLAADGWELVEDSRNRNYYYAQHPSHGRTPTMLIFADCPEYQPLRRLIDERRGYSLNPSPATPTPTRSRTATERLTAISQTIRDKQAAVGVMQTVVERLGNQHCTGRPWYRTTTNGKRYLYAIHPAGRVCPICGSHPDGARLRKFIAEADSEEARRHLQLITAANDYQSARQKLQRLEDQLQHIDRLIWQLEAATK